MRPSVTPKRRNESVSDRAAFVCAALLLLAWSLFWLRDYDADNDTWWHLATGRSIVENGIPTVDVLSWQGADTPWSPPEWLGSLSLYATFQHFGLLGLYWWRGGLVWLLLMGIRQLSRLRGAGPWSSIAISFVAQRAMYSNWVTRPLLLGQLAFVALLCMLSRHQNRYVHRLDSVESLQENPGRSPAWWIIPSLFFFWANTHPSWILGLGLLAMWTLTALFQPTSLKVLEARAKLEILSVLAMSAVATLLQPGGFSNVIYPLKYATIWRHAALTISEWQPPDWGFPIYRAALVPIALSFGGLLLSKNKSLFSVALVGIATAMSVRSGRFIFIFGPAFVWVWGDVSRQILKSIFENQRMHWLQKSFTSRPAFRWHVGATALSLVAVVFAIFLVPNQAQLWQLQKASLPIDAAERLAPHLQGQQKIYTRFAWGGWLEWRLPIQGAMLDSRLDPFIDNGLYERDRAFVSGRNNRDEYTLSHRFDFMILPQRGQDEYHFEMLQWANTSALWHLEWADETAQVFSRVP
jgi:hypothetical protein